MFYTSKWVTPKTISMSGIGEDISTSRTPSSLVTVCCVLDLVKVQD